MRFGQECLSLDTWCRKKQYDAFRQVSNQFRGLVRGSVLSHNLLIGFIGVQALGSGMNLHLKENDLLRDVLHLGEKVSSMSSPSHKQSKLERVSIDDLILLLAVNAGILISDKLCIAYIFFFKGLVYFECRDPELRHMEENKYLPGKI